MKKINFKSLPDTTTPINDTNLNTMQDNIEDAILENYSTEEQLIGNWTDGKPLYRRIIKFGALENAGTKSIYLSSYNIDELVDYKILIKSNNLKLVLPVIGANPVSYYYNHVNKIIGIETSSDRTGFTDNCIIALYTKTTD